LAANASQLEQLCDLADSRRHEPVGDALSYVVNRNLDTAAVAGSGTASRTRLVALVGEAHALGATEICMQGPLPASSADDYLDLIGAVTAGGSGVHLHAFRPSELLDGAARHKMPVDQFLAATRRAGLGSVPGTAARILDDEVRARTKGGPDLACLSGSR
jgi:FO synthase subunit 2